MSNLQHALQSPDFSAFGCGRYFKIFDTYFDIDVYEHGILTYLGSLVTEFHESVSPSMSEIAKSTKMSVSTVRKKLRGLEAKGYLKISSVQYLNAGGRTQQGSNHYFLTIQPEPTPPPMPVKSEVDTVVEAWEKELSSPVSASERETFVTKFDQLNQPCQHYLNRIVQIAADPKLKRVALNINFLFLPTEAPRPAPSEDLSSKEDGFPTDQSELLATINRQLTLEMSEGSKQRLEILRETVSKCGFGMGLKLYRKHVQHIQPEST